MNDEPSTPDQDPIEQQLLDLEDNPQATHDATVCNLHKELETLANDLKDPASEDPHEAESACRKAVEKVQTLASRPADTQPRLAADGNSDLKLNQVLGQYQILGKLGEGGMGAVYKALHTKLDKIVALKVLPEEHLKKADAIARFSREMKAVGKIEHPHLVRALDAGEAEGSHYLVMEYMDGIDLSRLLKRHGKLPVPIACELVRQAALGLQAAHQSGMVHRDIKPANLMLARQEFGPPVVKVLDLGLARLADDSGQAETELTTDNQIMGTLDYMAPEQAGSSKGADTRADVYSLGATLFTLLTGHVPFYNPEQQSIIQKLHALANQPLPDIREQRPDVPDDLAKVLEKMLAKEKDLRYAEPGEVAAALAPFAGNADLAPLLEEAKTTTSTPSLGRSTASWAIPSTAPTVYLPKPARRKPALIAAGLLLLLAPLVYLYAGTIIRFATNQGELAIEIDDPNIEVSIIQNGTVIKDKTKDREFTLTALAGQIEVLEKDGIKLTTKKFQLTRGGKTTVTVTLKELADARLPKTQRDRDAAEWVLSLNGRVIVETPQQRQTVTGSSMLPKSPFKLVLVDLQNNYKVKKRNLSYFQSVVNDDDLLHLNGLQHLTELNLAYSGITDKGLEHLTNLPNLAKLDLHFTQLKGLGLSHLTNLKNLEWLSLGGTHITGQGFASLKFLPRLQTLNLGFKPSQVIDKDLAHIKNVKSLTYLNLHETQVSDEGIGQLQELKHLEELRLTKTTVTANGIVKLQRLLPKCRIVWDGGVVAPMPNSAKSPTGKYALTFPNAGDGVTVANAADAERRVAAAVLRRGGTVQVFIDDPADFKQLHVERLEDLPPGEIHVEVVSYSDLDGITDDVLEELSPLDSVLRISLHNTNITDAGLVHLAKLRSLDTINLHGTQVTDAGLRHLADLPHLNGLCLTRTKLVSEGLDGFQRLAQLRHLILGGPMTKSRFLELAQVKHIRRLHLSSQAQVTEADVARFHEKNPYCRVFIDYKLIGADPVRQAAEELRKKGATLTVMLLSEKNGLGEGGYLEIPPDKPFPAKLFAVRAVSFYKSETVKDGDLDPIQAFPNLYHIELSFTNISDKGVEFLKSCLQLGTLGLHKTKITDRSLEVIVELPSLTSLRLVGTNITDAGVAKIVKLKNLIYLEIGSTPIGGPAFRAIAQLPKLKQLAMRGNNVTDEDLAIFAGMQSLQYIGLPETKVTGKGVDEFHKALPHCKIEWNGGVVEPDAFDREVAEWVLSIGGKVDVAMNDAPNASVRFEFGQSLPQAPFTIVTVLLMEKPEFRDEDLKRLLNLKNAWGLMLHSSEITDAELKILSQSKFKGLYLYDTPITDAGIRELVKMEQLDTLNLAGTKITDDALKTLSPHPKLAQLWLSGCAAITDDGIAQLTKLKSLEKLHLENTKLTDKSVDHLATMKSLKILGIEKTKFTAAGVEKLQQALPKCQIEWNGGVVEPATQTSPEPKP